MKTVAEVLRDQHVARPAGDNPLSEKLVCELLMLAEEVCVLRDRLDTVEKLAEEGRVADKAAIDSSLPDDSETLARLEKHKQFYADIMRRLSD